MAEQNNKKKGIKSSEAWKEARALVQAARWRLAGGAVLMIVNRLVGLVLPASSKFLIDEVVGKNRSDLILPVALAAGGATLLQAITSFSLSQILGVAAQRAITDMRKRVMAKIARLPISYFDSTQTGKLISRIMNDAEGIRNLVGTGLVQLTGSLITAGIALCVLFWLNWRLTSLTIVVLLSFGGGLAFAFRKLRPLFRERGEIQSELTGRLGESLGGIRIVKAYTAEKREELVFARGAHRLFRNVAKSMRSASS
jgi:subfamily B ATP-binding cassette protein MsbA